MSSIDDILASMRSSAPSGSESTAPPPSRSWTVPDERSAPRAPPLDDRHRVASAGASELDYTFKAGTLRISEADAVLLRKDCAMVFMLNSSNWLPAAAEPRCALERLARVIFEQHTSGVSFNVDTSGAEWWAQVRDGGKSHEGIEFHWDVDEHFCDLESGRDGVHVHPHLSTVTYLTDDGGAPTVVLNTRCPSSATPEAVCKVYGRLSSGAVSWPRLAKSIVFDGSELHGAVPPRGLGCAPGARRVTFLVNIWLGHRPFAVEPVPETLVRSLSQSWQPHPRLGAFESTPAPPVTRTVDRALEEVAPSGGASTSGHLEQADPESQAIEVAFGRNDKVHALRLRLPPREHGADSLRLLFAPGAAEVGANTTGLRCDRSESRKPKQKRESGETDSRSRPSGRKKKRKNAAPSL